MIVTRHGEIGSRAMRQYNTYVYIYYKKELQNSKDYKSIEIKTSTISDYTII